MQVIDLTGKTFNRLKVIERGTNTKQGQTRWKCICECGNTCEVISSKLRSGHTKSCGCLNREKTIARNKAMGTHGMSKHELFSTYTHMLARCYDENSSSYKYYGARGIKVCQAWRDSIHQFIKDIGKRPTKKHSLDRINNDGDYTPGNCRWATAEVQANNKRNNVKLTTKWGETHKLSVWADMVNLSPKVIYDRIHKLGWTVEQALGFEAAPEKKCTRTAFLTDDKGVTKSVREWSEELNIPYRRLIRRRNLGWSDVECLTGVRLKN